MIEGGHADEEEGEDRHGLRGSEAAPVPAAKRRQTQGQADEDRHIVGADGDAGQAGQLVVRGAIVGQRQHDEHRRGDRAEPPVEGEASHSHRRQHDRRVGHREQDDRADGERQRDGPDDATAGRCRASSPMRSQPSATRASSQRLRPHGEPVSARAARGARVP